MRALIALVLLALAGCANYRVSGSSATAAASGGVVYGTTTSASAGLFFAMMFGAMVASPETSVEATPAMSPTRTVNEQDCTQPVSFTGNLKCR